MDELLYPLGSWYEGLQFDGNCSTTLHVTKFFTINISHNSLCYIYTRTDFTVKFKKLNIKYISLDEQRIEFSKDKFV